MLRPGFFLSLLLSAALLRITAPFSAVAQITEQTGITDVVSTETLRLSWSQGTAEPSGWDILAGSTGDTAAWHSLITTSQVGLPLSHHLKLRGTIHGAQISQDPIPEHGLLLLTEYEKTDRPYCLKMTIVLENRATSPTTSSPSDYLTIILGPGLGQDLSKPAAGSSSTYSFVEPVIYRNRTVEMLRDGTTRPRFCDWRDQQPQWAGLHDRYFALMILPVETGKDIFLPLTKGTIKYPLSADKSVTNPVDFPEFSLSWPVPSLQPMQKVRWEFLVYAGPKSQKSLSAAPADLRPLLFSGLWIWMRWICFGLMYLMTGIHAVVPGWGLTIIILALIVRILLYPFAKKALISQRQFVEAQKVMLPEMTEIKKNFKGGEQSERILQLYKKYNVSPFAGLKPLMVVLVQLPILIALFQVLGADYDLRDAGFLWIRTLAEPDKLFSFGFTIPLLGSDFNLLPLLMAVVTMLSFKLTPSPAADKSGQTMQNLFMLGMTLMFFFLFYSFPSGMVLYWTFANVFHVLQHRMMIYFNR
jgi:YidC/Oxa1 family membrane protein insertase